MYEPTPNYLAHQTEYDEAIKKVCLHGKYINGPEVKELELKLKRYTKSSFCVGVANGTDALQIALMAIDIQPGDEVITTPLTWISTSEVIALLKATPVFVDVDFKSFNIDPSKIEEKITNRTRAIIPVNLFGKLADYVEINRIAGKHNLVVIEDACQSFGASHDDVKSCNLAHISCTSFFPTKPLGCYGDGGAIFTNDQHLATKIDFIKNHGTRNRTDHVIIGINSRLDTIQAAVLLVKMKYFDDAIMKRRWIANMYIDGLSDLRNIMLPKKDDTSAWAQFGILMESKDIRDYFMEEMTAAVFYKIPLHLQPCFSYLGYNTGDFPNAEYVSDHILNIPIYPECDYLDIMRQFVEIYHKKYC